MSLRKELKVPIRVKRYAERVLLKTSIKAMSLNLRVTRVSADSYILFVHEFAQFTYDILKKVAALVNAKSNRSVVRSGIAHVRLGGVLTVKWRHVDYALRSSGIKILDPGEVEYFKIKILRPDQRRPGRPNRPRRETREFHPIYIKPLRVFMQETLEFVFKRRAPYRISRKACLLLLSASVSHIMAIIHKAKLIVCVTKRVTLMPRDVRTAITICNRRMIRDRPRNATNPEEKKKPGTKKKRLTKQQQIQRRIDKKTAKDKREAKKKAIQASKLRNRIRRLEDARAAQVTKLQKAADREKKRADKIIEKEKKKADREKKNADKIIEIEKKKADKAKKKADKIIEKEKKKADKAKRDRRPGVILGESPADKKEREALEEKIAYKKRLRSVRSKIRRNTHDDDDTLWLDEHNKRKEAEKVLNTNEKKAIKANLILFRARTQNPEVKEFKKLVSEAFLNESIAWTMKLVRPGRFQSVRVLYKEENEKLLNDIMFWSGVVAGMIDADEHLEETMEMYDTADREYVHDSLFLAFKLADMMDTLHTNRGWTLGGPNVLDLEEEKIKQKERWAENKVPFKTTIRKLLTSSDGNVPTAKILDRLKTYYVQEAVREPTNKRNKRDISRTISLVLLTLTMGDLKYKNDTQVTNASKVCIDLLVTFVFIHSSWGIRVLPKPRFKVVRNAMEQCFDTLSSWFTDLTQTSSDQGISKRILMNFPILFQISTCILILWDIMYTTKELPSGFGETLGYIIQSATTDRTRKLTKKNADQQYKIGVSTYFSNSIVKSPHGKAYHDWLIHITPLHFCMVAKALYH
jgi:hypothetical protein